MTEVGLQNSEKVNTFTSKIMGGTFGIFSHLFSLLEF